MQTTANRTVANSLPKNEVILLTLLISKRYIPYTDFKKQSIQKSATPIMSDDFLTTAFDLAPS